MLKFGKSTYFPRKLQQGLFPNMIETSKETAVQISRKEEAD
ncbi:hypothetical protein CLOSTASPAR_04172 [[Clostridium] asparagiforme DSM 15981]|uniref:Uncharacterized protein n=1 Tax=[Clostridium] asparagiforme DSM 15981 TaxID=518636 RepID=C0D4H8_9FIRM|nr:hypothetical protein CLOSTASPAR_04172 [[Clostridium] asparagiforme DSM 15981]